MFSSTDTVYQPGATLKNTSSTSFGREQKVRKCKCYTMTLNGEDIVDSQEINILSEVSRHLLCRGNNSTASPRWRSGQLVRWNAKEFQAIRWHLCCGVHCCVLPWEVLRRQVDGGAAEREAGRGRDGRDEVGRM